MSRWRSRRLGRAEAETEAGAQVRPVLDLVADGRRHGVTGLKELNLFALDWRVQIAILVVIVGFAF